MPSKSATPNTCELRRLSLAGKVYIVTGGYPCQPFSFAGKRQGDADPRHLSPRSSTNDLTFNPNFSDWIMGWPIGWTDPMQPVTGWSAWLQLMRGELSRLPTI
ncbi:DNA cytosine methyltransferase [Phyllobacterium bourgognense]|uniref:DNA cytosine methyltransferase n=1 Tax=Phyllobacterium bourgognense TaxID=314236 RepID=UPI001FE13A2F|nr:DNA cytosine methyltransferase [Phyllobacterium bourgognense]